MMPVYSRTTEERNHQRILNNTLSTFLRTGRWKINYLERVESIRIVLLAFLLTTSMFSASIYRELIFENRVIIGAAPSLTGTRYTLHASRRGFQQRMIINNTCTYLPYPPE